MNRGYLGPVPWDFDRFKIMDLAFASVLLHYFAWGILRVVFSYNIACKYGIHFWPRVSEGEYQLLDPMWELLCCIIWLVPKFHLNGHKRECMDNFSFNFTKWVGRVSGELVETPWASFNWLKYSTRKMLSGARIDLLSDHFSEWNWGKNVRAGERLLPELLPVSFTNSYARI